MAPGRFESDFPQQGWIDTLGLKQIFSIFSVYTVNSQLSILNLGDNNITNEGVKQLSNVIVNSQLSSLVPWGNNITDEGVKQLSNVNFL